MSLQRVWNSALQRWEWEDLTYTAGRKDAPDPHHGQPAPSGWQPGECPACSGLGYLWDELSSQNKVCSLCDGAGRVAEA